MILSILAGGSASHALVVKTILVHVQNQHEVPVSELGVVFNNSDTQ